MVDARQFESNLELRPGLNKKDYPKLVEYEGNGVLLRLADVRTYGGIMRYYMDGNGKPIRTGAATVPMRVTSPYRLSENGAYVLLFHLAVSNLPEDVYCRVIPTEEVGNDGILFNTNLIREGALEVASLSLRKIEIRAGYPVGLLVFEKYAEDAKQYQGVKSNAKSSSSKSKQQS